MQPIGVHCCEVMYFGFRGGLGFLNCDDVCMCVVNKQFELLEFVSEFVNVDLQYDEISLTLTAGSVCLCGVSRVLLFVLHVCILRECEGMMVTEMLVWGQGEVWLW